MNTPKKPKKYQKWSISTKITKKGATSNKKYFKVQKKKSQYTPKTAQEILQKYPLNIKKYSAHKYHKNTPTIFPKISNKYLQKPKKYPQKSKEYPKNIPKLLNLLYVSGFKCGLGSECLKTWQV